MILFYESWQQHIQSVHYYKQNNKILISGQVISRNWEEYPYLPLGIGGANP